MAASLSVPVTPGLATWLEGVNSALVFSTYRANRLIFVGRSIAENTVDQKIMLHERLFDRPMGLYVAGESIWVATRCQIWRLDNLLTPGLFHEGGDRLYVPAASFITGDINTHELVVGGDGLPVFVNTAFSCLATVGIGCSFAPIWKPAFISKLCGDDRCHLNGIGLLDGLPTWASACGDSDGASSWRTNRRSGGVLLHIPSGDVVASGLSMPHSPRWYQGKLWLLQSGTGELGWIDDGKFQAVCALPGFARGLAFAGGCAVVGISKIRSAHFSGLAVEERLIADGMPEGLCGLRVIDLASGEILHKIDLPDPIDELFDVAVIAGVRQPRALGLQGEEIECLVKLPETAGLVHLRPLAPSAGLSELAKVGIFGLPKPATELGNAHTIHYQRVFHLTPANLEPYLELTHPVLAPGGAAVARIRGELLGVSAMAAGVMVGLAIAELNRDGGASLISIKVAPEWRRRGVGAGLVQRLMLFLTREGITPLQVRYMASREISFSFEPILYKLGWSGPLVEFVLLKSGINKLACIDWYKRFPITQPYSIVSWGDFMALHNADQVMKMARELDPPEDLLPPLDSSQLNPIISSVLLFGDQLVGWLLADQASPSCIRYKSIFVAANHRGSARGLALLANSFSKQSLLSVPDARAAVPPDKPDILNLLRRHLGPYLTGIGEARFSSHNLSISNPVML